MADEFVWRGGSGAFGTAGNWDDLTTGSDPSAVPPGAADTAEFSSGGGTITGIGTVAQLQFLGSVAWIVDASAQLTDTASFLDGGPLTVQNGSTIVSSGPQATIDSGDTATTAALLVTGAGSDFAVTGASTWLYVGTSGNASLSVTNGASVSASFLVSLGGYSGASSLSVDSTSSLEVGTAGGAAAGVITIDPEANGISHQILGYGTIAAAVVDNGNIQASADPGALPLEVTGAVTGTGQLNIANGYVNNGTNIPGAVLQLDGPVGTGLQLGFGLATVANQAPTLILKDPIAFDGTLDNFSSPGDTLDLAGQTVTGASVTGSTLTVTLASGGPLNFTLGFGGPTTAQLLVDGSDIQILPIRELDWTGNGADQSFGDRLNWNDITDGINPAAAAPSTPDLASISNGGSIAGTASVYQLSFAGTNTVTGALTALDTLSETNGSLAVTGTLGVAGATIAGTLTAKSGGRITSSGSLVLTSGAVIATDGGSSVETGTAGAPAEGSITVDAAGGFIDGDGTLAAPLINNGTVEAEDAIAGGNTLEITGAVTGTGLLNINNGYNVSADVYQPGGVLRFDSTVASTQTVQLFDSSDPGAASALVLGDPTGFAGTIEGLSGSGNTLDLLGEAITGASVSGSTLTVTVASGGPLTFNLGYGAPTNSQLLTSGSDIHILPDRLFAWTGTSSNNVGVAANWNDTTDGLNPANTAPLATDLIVITNAGLMTGTGTAYQANFYGTNTVAGTLSTADFLAENTGSLTVTGSLNAGTINVYATLAAASGGRITTPGMVQLYAGTEISVDGASSVEAGTAGTASAGALTVDASGAGIGGDGTLAAALVNNGAIDADAGTTGTNVLEVTGSVTGGGTLYADHGYISGSGSVFLGGLLQLDAGVGAAQTVEFDAATDPRVAPELRLGAPSAFAGTLSDFDSPGETLELTGETVTGVSVNGAIMTVSLAAGGPLTFTMGGQIPLTGQLLASGSEIRVVPVRELDWTGAGGNTNFATPANWDDITEGLDPAGSAPGDADLASVSNAGTVTGNGIAYQLIFAGTNTVAGSLAAVSTLTETSGSSAVTGTLAMAGASLAGTLAAKAGGRITSNGAMTLSPGAMLAVDGTSFMEIGTAGTGTAGNLTVDPAGSVQLSGDGTLAAALVNNGQITADFGAAGSNELEITGAVTGTGTLTAETGYIVSPGTVLPGAILRIDSTVASSQQVGFAFASGPAVAPEVVLGDPAGFQGSIANFNGAGDTLDLVGDTINGASVSGTVMTVTLAAGGPLTFNLAGGVPQTNQLLASGSTIRVVPLRDLTWTGASGNNFGNAQNWNDTSDGLNPAASAPGSSDLASMTNAGSIVGTGAAYQMIFAGTNTITGSLTAGNSLTETTGALTVTGTLDAANPTLSGTISAVTGGQFQASGLVALSAGAVLAVDGTSSIEVGTAGGAAAGFLTVDAASDVPLFGDGTLAAAVVNNSGINANAATAGGNMLEVTGAVTGTGAFGIASGTNPSANVYTPGGILRFDAAVAGTQVIGFNSAAAAQEAPTLALADPAGFLGTLSAFTSAGDTLDLVGDTVTGATIVGTTMTVTVAGSGPLTFNLANTPSTTPLSFSGSDVEVVACYAAGTAILTPNGEIAVEVMRRGDLVMTVEDGCLVPRPVVWAGVRVIDLDRRGSSAPIQFHVGALGPNRPHRDLWLSPDHALFIDGVLIPASLLVNGVTIVQDRTPRAITYHHIELDEHGVLLAEGVEAESYLDTDNHAGFRDPDAATFLNPDFRTGRHLGRWETDACAPLIVRPEAVRPIWERFAARAGVD